MEDKKLILKQYESYRPPGDFHTHSYSHLAYVHQGCQILSTDKHSLLSMPGSLVYIPAYTPHRAEFLKRSQVSLLKLPSNSTPNIEAVSMLDVSPIITQLFSVWKNETQDPKLADQYIDVLIDQCSRCAPTTHPFVAQGSMDRRLLIIIEALSDKPTIKMSISQLSQKTGASVRTLNRLFLSHFKASFKEIRNKVVMERAEQMMKKGISATVVAFELEYSSLSSFSTAYNKHQKTNMD